MFILIYFRIQMFMYLCKRKVSVNVTINRLNVGGNADYLDYFVRPQSSNNSLFIIISHDPISADYHFFVDKLG